MRDNQHFGLAALALGLLTVPSLAQTTPTPAPTPLPAGAAAVVNGQAITEIAVWRGLQGIEPERRERARAEILNLFVENAILDQYVLQMQIKVEKDEIDKKLADGRKELKERGKDFDKMMQELKLSEAEMREQVAANIRWDKFTDTQVNPKVLQDLFAAEKDFFNDSRVRARHILLTPAANDPKAAEAAVAQLRQMKQQVEKKAAAAVAALPANSDNLAKERERIKAIDKEFADLATEKSACPTRAVGGELPVFTRDGMVEPFARAAFALQPYQMSDVVQTPFGYHLILVTDRKAGTDVKFEDMKDQVRELYCLRLRDAIVAKYRPNAKITIAPAPPAETPAKP